MADHKQPSAFSPQLSVASLTTSSLRLQCCVTFAAGGAVQLMHTAEVVIIGGGIVGSSIAYHLTAAGCRGGLVIERESAQGKGSTGQRMGGVRGQVSDAASIQMSLYSIPFYASFEERLGHPSGYRPQGYLFCATNEKH